MQDLEAIVKEALAAFADIDDAAELERAKARYLGKSGVLTQLLKGLSKLPAAERPAFGSRVNAAKEQLEASLAEQRSRTGRVTGRCGGRLRCGRVRRRLVLAILVWRGVRRGCNGPLLVEGAPPQVLAGAGAHLITLRRTREISSAQVVAIPFHQYLLCAPGAACSSCLTCGVSSSSTNKAR